MRVLFFPLITRGPASGTISRCLAIAEHLRSLGNDVFFLTNGHGIELVSEAGFPFIEGVLPDSPGHLHPLYDLSDVAIFLNLTTETHVRRTLKSEIEAVKHFCPDVLFSEFNLTAPITAAIVGLPLISTACSPADSRFAASESGGLRSIHHIEAIMGFNKVLAEHHQQPIANVSELFFMRSDLKIAPTIPEIEPLLQDVPNLQYVGYLLDDRRELAPIPGTLLERVGRAKLVFVYLSGSDIGPAEYTDVLPQAFDNTEFHVITAVGNHPDLPDLPPKTANVIYVRYVPGRSILKHSQALIFHGGQNTAMASIIHKVPSLIFPGTDFERNFNASSLDRIGVGMKCELCEFSPEKLLQNVRALASPHFHEAADKYSKQIQQLGGARQAAELIMSKYRG
ncbi:MAG: glycosyltransferase [Desulfomonilaceae bacterium]